MTNKPSEEDLGFRSLLTRAPIAENLLASPTQYDAAPTYLGRAYADQSEEVKVELARAMGQQVAAQSATDTIGRQVLIAAQLAAPIGFGLVRIVALAEQLGSVLASFNPVVAVLTVPALFFTGKKTLEDMRRAFVVDPKVRHLIDRGRAASDAGDHKRAEGFLKEALEVCIDPSYQRNGDLYLQLGLVQMADRRPRQAMVSLARASVLFGEKDVLNMPHGDGTVQVSKRGWCELLACAAIDSFAVDDPQGLEEWSSLVQDFATSAGKRLESVASGKDAGHLFGLFGVDEKSAEFGRELAAKARFLVAKMKLRGVGGGDQGDVDALLDEGLRDLESSKSLTNDERFEACMQQAQYFARLAAGDGAKTVSASRAMRLMDRAARLVEDENPSLAARVRAESAGFVLEIIPAIVASGQDATALREETDRLLSTVAGDAQNIAASIAMAPIAAGWAEEQRFHLATTRESRAEAIRRAHAAYLSASEPVAALYSALRFAYQARSREETLEAVNMIVQAGKAVLESEQDPVSRAYASRYIAEAGELLGTAAPTATWEQTAEQFLEAADHVRRTRQMTAFTLHGKPLVHPAPVARLVLQAHAAQMLARAGQAGRAIALLEQVRAAASSAAATVLAAFDLDHAEVLRALGHIEEAKSMAESVERDARGTGDSNLQRRALELLHALSHKPTEQLSVEGPDSNLLEEPAEDASLLSSYARDRERLVKAGRAILDVLDQPELRARFADNERTGSVLQLLRAKMARLEEGRFRVGIVGEFSSGKSTFINALLGDSVLPSAVRPTTSTPNLIAWGEEPTVRIQFTDGHTETTQPSNLASFVTEKGNPGNERGVYYVEIDYPTPLLQRGLELLDTPGVSSLVTAHDKVTYEQIPTCDAVILLATGRQPFSESVGDFLEHLRSVLENKVFYVINKIDQVDLERRADSVKFAQDRVAEKVSGARVFALSAYRALAARRLLSGKATPEDFEEDPRVGDDLEPNRLLSQSGLSEFESELNNYLLAARGTALLQSTAGDLLNTLYQIESQIATERQSCRSTVAQRLQLHRELSADVAKRRQEAQDALEHASLRFQSILDDARARASREVPALTDTILERAALSADDFGSKEARAAVQDRLGYAARQAVQQWAEATSREVSLEIASAVDSARAVLQKHRRELRTHFRSELAGDAPLALPPDEPIQIEFDMNSNAAGRLLVEALVNFVSGFFLGIVGIFVGTVLGKIVTTLLFGGDSAVVEKAHDAIRPHLHKEMAALGVRLGDDIADWLGPKLDDIRTSLDSIAEQVLSEFDRQLAVLIQDHEEESDALYQTEALLQLVQTRAAASRATLEAIRAGSGR